MEQQTKATLDSALKALGESIHEIVEAALQVDDVSVTSTKPVVFNSSTDKGPYGQGLQWKGAGATKQFAYRANPDRLWTSEDIDLSKDKAFMINNRTVLSENELGNSVRKSSLQEVGTLRNLRTAGNLTIDESIFYNSETERLGLGTDAPKANLTIASLDSEFIIDLEGTNSRLGTWTTDDLELVTDNTTRVTIDSSGNVIVGNKDRNDAKMNVFGTLGVGVNNVRDGVSLAVKGPVEIQGKKIESGTAIPVDGKYKQGDIVWNSDPKPTGYVGWICVRDGVPGEWKPFGLIAN